MIYYNFSPNEENIILDYHYYLSKVHFGDIKRFPELQKMSINEKSFRYLRCLPCFARYPELYEEATPFYYAECFDEKGKIFLQQATAAFRETLSVELLHPVDVFKTTDAFSKKSRVPGVFSETAYLIKIIPNPELKPEVAKNTLYMFCVIIRNFSKTELLTHDYDQTVSRKDYSVFSDWIFDLHQEADRGYFNWHSSAISTEQSLVDDEKYFTRKDALSVLNQPAVLNSLKSMYESIGGRKAKIRQSFFMNSFCEYLDKNSIPISNNPWWNEEEPLPEAETDFLLEEIKLPPPAFPDDDWHWAVRKKNWDSFRGKRYMVLTTFFGETFVEFPGYFRDVAAGVFQVKNSSSVAGWLMAGGGTILSAEWVDILPDPKPGFIYAKVKEIHETLVTDGIKFTEKKKAFCGRIIQVLVDVSDIRTYFTEEGKKLFFHASWFE